MKIIVEKLFNKINEGLKKYEQYLDVTAQRCFMKKVFLIFPETHINYH